MRIVETSDADVYSNIGGIDQPTYFSGLTHCSLNREVEGNVLFRIKKNRNMDGNIFAVDTIVFNVREKEGAASPALTKQKGHFYRFIIW